MAGMNVDGLVSGLDTTALVKSLMELEKQPQVRLQGKLTKTNTLVGAYQTLNTRALALKDAATAIAEPKGWQATKASSSVPASVAVSASADAQPASLSFTVQRLAAAHSAVSAGGVPTADTVVATGDLKITIGGEDHVVALGDKGEATLTELVGLINKADIGITASAVQVSAGSFRLQLNADEAGAASTFTVGPAVAADPDDHDAVHPLAALGSTFTTVTQGVDSELHVGTPPDNGYAVTRSGNTVSDLLPGVTLTLSKADPDTTVKVGVTRDAAALADKVGKLVETLNSTFTYIKLQGSYNAETKAGGPLLGDATSRQVQTSLYRAMGTVPEGKSLKEFGLSITKEGLLSVDKAALTKAYEADPAAIVAFFAGEAGYATGIANAAKEATAPRDVQKKTIGTIAAAIEGRQGTARSITLEIEKWDTRLALRENNLKRQFSGLESALSKLNSQSTWLAGQLSGLSANNQ